ncbi:uncharacterized protein TRIADDRAFT_54286 [Trichoplax adhaerens]|uniref:JmjC domain-containing protein n=1 Tax=Trichoplax adhaerens TaxID=10228 RepID=B3RRL7_TRIAD|nr:hypothetical protein TRIADDRAFT_54286 [Trichoplax adhaerens]EDV26371.1 hypothetical protein TRIADDRAFT_54286 [Trichoplax adhaerens]|eukprot:XP_002110367.1 hypothetical protein TRIADDRAFT_54286 [Trichoplax adhaerens]
MAYSTFRNSRIQIILLILSLYYCRATVDVSSDAFIKGHMKPLGSHREPLAVEELTSIPNPKTFYDLYTKPGKPVILRNAAKAIPAFSLWTDEYLSEKFGNVQVLVEEGKKENRSKGNFMTSLKEFVNSYKTEDLYVVHTVPKEMREDIRMLPCVSCGGYAEKLLDVVMWFSSGGTKSVLHNDGYENLNCLFRGTKELVMIDKNVDYDAIFDNNGFSNLDVDKVDLKKYSDLIHMKWYKAKMSAGDCIFIPQFWLHQVRSYDSNLAVNMWWIQLLKFNESSCEKNKDVNYLNTADYEFATYELLRNSILDYMPKSKRATKQTFKRILTRCEVGPIVFPAVFSTFDSNKDDVVSFDEVQDLPYGEFSKLFPNWNYESEEAEELEPERDEL